MVDDRAAEPSAVPAHMPQLDGLRALAVLGVMLHHYRPAWIRHLPLGALGVMLFFVLSGYLITNLLLTARTRLAVAGAASTLRTFYIRRSLRIFPLYYAVLAVLWACGSADVREHPWWHIFYASNIRVSVIGFYPRDVAHFWSLAIEEQFYLVWPAIVLFTPRRRLLTVLLGMVLLGPLYRLDGVVIGAHLSTDWLRIHVMTLAHIDSLALGGVLALTSRREFAAPHAQQRLLRVAMRVALPLAIVMQLNEWWLRLPLGVPSLLVWNTVWALLFVLVVHGAARGFGGGIGALLQQRMVRGVGRISYALYIFHPLVPPLISATLAAGGIGLAKGSWTEFALWMSACLALATASWHLFERPINELKDRFTRGEPTTAHRASAPAV